ncbi:MAG: diadenylate cyclase CdaA [Lachnospiraceae bacterium]|nr:diadenylate cyclase CdaA [Lachnospiraceae bacterium]MDD6684845.1 diadenylate cyclase CdaA [Lachnospiraceae bacterium]MDD7048215.1 diadenylate cyclase CdaA [Lachnospiraceae bacterium]HBB61493.1 TIGR00159 family protein [Lachnospiraceae bacterium]
MDAVLGWLQINVLSWLKPPKTIQVIDIVQIALIAWLVYRMILWMKNTRAYTLLRGILFILGFVVIANLLKMEVIVWLMGNLSVVAFTAIVIIFQPELRKALEQMGHSNFVKSLMVINRSPEENKRFSDHTVSELVRACFEMSEVKTGALIVLERETHLYEYENTGIPLDAVVSSQLLVNIFEHNTPLHDGAVLIRADRIAAATCYLPLSDNMDLSKKLGTRHRAGVGISEQSDCFVLIVSEETGAVSYAQNGRLHAAVSPSELRRALQEAQKIYDDSARILKRGRKRNEI